MASGTKYGAGVFNAAQGSGVTVEVYSGFGGSAPAHFVRFAFMSETRTPRSFDASDQGCFSYQTFTGWERDRAGSIAWMGLNNDDVTALDDQLCHYSFYGASWINDGATLPTGDYFYSAQSTSTNSGVIRAGPNGTTSPNTTAYAALNFEVASNGAVVNWNSITLVDSVGQNVQRTIGDTDVLIVFGNYNYTTINSQFSSINRFTLGFFDVRSTNRPQGWGFHRGYWAGGGLTDLNGVSRNRLANLRLNPDGFRWQITPSSLSDGRTLTLEVTSTFNTIGSTPTLQLFSFKLKPETAYKINATRLNMPVNSTDQLVEIQTNSVKPEACYALFSFVKSIDYHPMSADNNCQGFSQGVWAASDGYAIAGCYTQFKPNTSDLLNTAADNWFGYMYHTYSGAFGAGLRSLDPADNKLDIWVNATSPTMIDGSVLCYFMMGEKVAAPAHLMDASSSSIFLADQEDYPDNLMLVAGPPVATPTMKFGHYAYLVSSADTLETYSGELTGTPQFRFSMMAGATVLNTPSNNGRISAGFMSISSDLTLKSAVTAYRNQDGSPGANIINYHNVSSNQGPGVLNSGAASFVAESQVQSVGPGLVRNKFITGAASYGIIAFSWTGSFYNRTGQLAAAVDIANVGSAEIFSTDMTPHLIFASVSHSNTGNGFKGPTGYDESTWTFGFYDARSSIGRYVNFGHSGAGGDTVMGLISDQMVKVSCGDDGIGNYWMDIDSVGASGFFVKVTSVPLALSDRTQVALTAFSFLDSATNFQVGDFVLPTSSEASSIALPFTPRFAMFLATDNKSINCIPASEGLFGRGDGFSIGFWANSTDMAYAGYNQEGNASGTNNKSFVGDDKVAYISQGNNALIAELGSVTANSTGLSFYSDVFSTVGQNTRMAYLIIGDEGAASVDPGSAAPAAGGALFRTYPITDNRLFPTPLTNVRDFPSD